MDVSLIERLSKAPEQQQAVRFLAEYSKRMVLAAFLGKDNPISPSSLVKEIYQVCDNLLAGRLRSRKKPACKEGCFWCCYLKVMVTPLEIISIYDYLQTNIHPVEYDALQKRLQLMEKISR